MPSSSSSSSNTLTMQELEQRLGKFSDFNQLPDKDKKAILSASNRMSLYGAVGSLALSMSTFSVTRGRPVMYRLWSTTFAGLSGFFFGTAIGAYQATRKLVTLPDSMVGFEMRKIISEQRNLGKQIPWVFRDIELTSEDRVRLASSGADGEGGSVNGNGGFGEMMTDEQLRASGTATMNDGTVSRKPSAWDARRLPQQQQQKSDDASGVVSSRSPPARLPRLPRPGDQPSATTESAKKKSAWDAIREQNHSDGMTGDATRKNEYGDDVE